MHTGTQILARPPHSVAIAFQLTTTVQTPYHSSDLDQIGNRIALQFTMRTRLRDLLLALRLRPSVQRGKSGHRLKRLIRLRGKQLISYCPSLLKALLAC